MLLDVKTHLIILFSAAVVFSAYAQGDETEELTWYTDIDSAYVQSTTTKKPIFAFFTGSDWCGWCHKLQREVFAKPAFVEWAQDNVILLELDFPRRKQLPEETIQQNRMLQQFFQVRGFPTIWLFYLTHNAEKKTFEVSALGSLGYPPNAERGKEEVAFLQQANSILAKDATRN